MVNSDQYTDFKHASADFIARGMYAPALAWYLRYFDPSDILILQFEKVSIILTKLIVIILLSFGCQRKRILAYHIVYFVVNYKLLAKVHL